MQVIKRTMRTISPKAFASLGIENLAYVKRSAVRGTAKFTAYAADGSLLMEFADRAIAEVALRRHDLEPMSVH
jgi:hypothetical protein